jgi:hypothetical protein
MSDGKSDVVPQHRGDEPDRSDRNDVELTRSRVHRGGDQHRLSWGGHPEVLQQYQGADGQVAVLVEHRGEGTERAGEHGCGHDHLPRRGRGRGAGDEEPIVRDEIAWHPIWPGAVVQPGTGVDWMIVCSIGGVTRAERASCTPRLPEPTVS